MSVQDHGASDEHTSAPHDPVESSDEHSAPPLAEPESPAWLPLLGGALLLMGLVVFLLTRSPEPTDDSAAANAPASAAPAAPAPTALSPAVRPDRLRMVAPRPAASP